MKKYQIFIDNKKQESFYEEKYEAKYFDIFSPSNKDMLHIIEEPNTNYFQVIKEVTVNSNHQEVIDLFKRNKIALENFNVYRNYKKVKIFYWDCVPEKSLPNNIKVLTERQGFFSKSKKIVEDTKENTDTFHVIEILNPKLLSFYLNSKLKYQLTDNNLLCAQNILGNEKLIIKDTKYRLFLNERLLVERFFPSGLRNDKSLVEIVYLDITSPKTIKLITENDLVIAKVIADKTTFYPNSKEFILEP